MHLSFLANDNYPADHAYRLADCQRVSTEAHWNGLVRGIVFMAVLAFPFGLTYGSAAVRDAGIDRTVLAEHADLPSMAASVRIEP